MNISSWWAPPRRTTTIIIAVTVVIMAALVYFSTDRGVETPPKRFEGTAFRVLLGDGGTTPQGASLRSLPPNGQGVIAVLANELSAATYRRLRFSVTGLEAAVGAGVYWHRKSDPTVSHFRALTLEQVRSGVLQLGPEDQWSGDIQTFGFVVQGPISTPVTIGYVEFSAPDDDA